MSYSPFNSIPAIFGLTNDPFLVFCANLFALLGLRHLYFLIGRLLTRLVYLSAGLAVVLTFIGIKLIGEALRAYGVDPSARCRSPRPRRGVTGDHHRDAGGDRRGQRHLRPSRAVLRTAAGERAGQVAGRPTTARATAGGRAARGSRAAAGTRMRRAGRRRDTGRYCRGPAPGPVHRAATAGGYPPAASLPQPRGRREHTPERPRGRPRPSRRWPAG